MKPLTELYQLALNAFDSRTAESGLELETRLENLRPTLRRLREDFATTDVRVPYSHDRCDAYSLAYYPIHASVFRSILERLNISPSNGAFRVCAFGAGPAPEVYAITTKLKALPDWIGHVEFSLYDLRSREWARTRNSLVKAIAEQSSIDIRVRAPQLDLGDPVAIGGVERSLRRADLIVMMNICNEITDAGWPGFQQTIQAAGAFLKRGAIMIVSELVKHRVNRDRFRTLEMSLASGFDVLVASIRPERPQQHQVHNLKALGSPPPILEKYFFADEDFLRARSTLNYDFFALVKSTD